MSKGIVYGTTNLVSNIWYGVSSFTQPSLLDVVINYIVVSGQLRQEVREAKE